MLSAGVELWRIALTLAETTEKKFVKQLDDWHQKQETFLKEKTINPITGKWFYTHKRVRSAYRSLKTNLPYLFIYQKYPKLYIPNTTNSLDGSFNTLKTLLRNHRGLGKENRYKMICEIFKDHPPEY